MYKRWTENMYPDMYKHIERYTSVDKTNLRLIKKYLVAKRYNNVKELYKKLLHKFDFVPRMEFNDKKFEITEEFIKNHLTKENKPDDYINQLKKINNTFEKHKLFHNDLHIHHHIRLKDKKIFIIDFDRATLNVNAGGENNRLDKSNNILDLIKKYK